jgi:predicted YcjX-like family ATPase
MRTVRVAVTGLRQAGKTVFLTSLINHLLEGSEETLEAFQDEAVTFSARRLPLAAHARTFPYYAYLEALRHERPAWPERTYDVSEFRLELTLRNLKKRRTRVLALELVDCPGERLLDMPMLRRDYAAWSDEVVREAAGAPKDEMSADWLTRCAGLRADAVPTDAASMDAVAAYRDYVGRCRERGFTYLQPAAMLMGPERVAGVSVGFCPLPAAARERAGRVAQRFGERYDAYVRDYVRPFFVTAARCTRQIVLVDVLKILRQGVHSYNDTRRCLRAILDAYVYATQRHPLSPMRLVDAFRTQISRVAFVATKADQCTRATRGNLRFLLEELVNPKRRQLIATLPDGRPRIMFCAAHRATEDAVKLYEGRDLSCLRGRREDVEPDREGPWFPGEVPPEWPADDWDPGREQFVFPNFLPPHLPQRDGAVIPHVNLDKVLHYIMEDLIP